ncbi:hypothetical protein A2U01_0062932, partial [Trifolium medium]|nr:hypothetical protein [Trifolium medium]
RFRRGDTRNEALEDQDGKQARVVATVHHQQAHLGRSFKQAVMGKPVEGRRMKNRKKESEAEYLANVMEVEIVPENLAKLQNSYVGFLWDAKEAKIMQLTIWMEGYQKVVVRSMGM